jgi:hypothetical protein
MKFILTEQKLIKENVYLKTKRYANKFVESEGLSSKFLNNSKLMPQNLFPTLPKHFKL